MAIEEVQRLDRVAHRALEFGILSFQVVKSSRKLQLEGVLINSLLKSVDNLLDHVGFSTHCPGWRAAEYEDEVLVNLFRTVAKLSRVHILTWFDSISFDFYHLMQLLPDDVSGSQCRSVLSSRLLRFEVV